MSFSDRKFMIINVSDLDNIDFTKVLETSKTTVRKSVDETKTFVKWNGDTPQTILDLTTKEGPYTHQQMLAILDTPEWKKPQPI